MDFFVPGATFLSNDEVAAIIERAYKRRAESAIKQSADSWTLGKSKLIVNTGHDNFKPKPDVNRVFLNNTIQNVESHNKREVRYEIFMRCEFMNALKEVEECWRQHDAMKRSRRPQYRTNSPSSYSYEDRRPSQNLDVDAERQFWAMRKVNHSLYTTSRFNK